MSGFWKIFAAKKLEKKLVNVTEILLFMAEKDPNKSLSANFFRRKLVKNRQKSSS
jgi:hypothetical protein